MVKDRATGVDKYLGQINYKLPVSRQFQVRVVNKFQLNNIFEYLDPYALVRRRQLVVKLRYGKSGHRLKLLS